MSAGLITRALLLSAAILPLLAACGSSTPAPEPVLLSQFNQSTDRFGVVSTVGKAEGTIQKDGRACDIYRIYTTGLTSGGRAALKAGEVLTSVATLGLAQIVWAPVKAGTRPQLHTVLFCFGSNGKLVDIYDKNPTDSTGPDHLILNPIAYSQPVVLQPVPAPAPILPTATLPAGPFQPSETPAVVVPGVAGAPVIYEKAIAPKAAAAAGTISLDNVSQEATTGLAQVRTPRATIASGATADDLNGVSAAKSIAANSVLPATAPTIAPQAAQ